MKALFVLTFLVFGLNYSANAELNCKWDKTNMESGFDKPFSQKNIQSDGVEFVHAQGDYQLVAKVFKNPDMQPELRIFYKNNLIGVSSGKYLGVRTIDDVEKFYTITCE